MANLTKIVLSGSTNGRGIAITGTAIAGATTIHTVDAVTTSGLGDELVLYAYNNDTSSHTLTIATNGTGSSTSDYMAFTVAGGVTTQIMAGLLFNNALVICGFADTASKFNVFGYVIRSQ